MREQIKKHRLDIIIIAAILLVATVALVLTLALRERGDAVRVTVGGVTVGEYPLSVDATYTLNGGTNILVIEGGVAYLSYADCPDKTCVNTGKIKYVGQSIVCLPNKITVAVIGDDDGGVDLIS